MVDSWGKLNFISFHSQKRSTEKTHRCHVLVDWIIHLVRLNIGLDSISPISLGSLFVLFFEGFGITQFISRVFDTGEITCLGLVLSCTVVDLVWIWEGQHLGFTRLMDFAISQWLGWAISRIVAELVWIREDQYLLVLLVLWTWGFLILSMYLLGPTAWLLLALTGSAPAH